MAPAGNVLAAHRPVAVAVDRVSPGGLAGDGSVVVVVGSSTAGAVVVGVVSTGGVVGVSTAGCVVGVSVWTWGPVRVLRRLALEIPGTARANLLC